MKRFNAFLSKVPKCPIFSKSDNEHEASVCLIKRSDCILSLLAFNAKILRNRDCSCTGTHSHSCGRFTFICALNRNECELFNSKKYQSTYETVKKCEIK